MTLYHVALLLVDWHRRVPSGMTALRITFCIALLNVRVVTWYISIIFTWNSLQVTIKTNLLAELDTKHRTKSLKRMILRSNTKAVGYTSKYKFQVRNDYSVLLHNMTL